VQAVEWSYANDVARSPNRSVTATILTRHHFSSNLKRMSAVVRVDDNDSGTGPVYEVVMKGAPEVVKQFLGEGGEGGGACQTDLTLKHPQLPFQLLYRNYLQPMCVCLQTCFHACYGLLAVMCV
jgi:magnesium-transporting ATPase (P-type)